MADISKISVPGQSTPFDIKDSFARTALSNLTGAMVFKGTLGTGGTITSLPAASSDNTGFTYRVITAGTYASQAAKVGDVFVSNGTAWVLIPAGDEPTYTLSGETTSATQQSVKLTPSDGTAAQVVPVVGKRVESTVGANTNVGEVFNSYSGFYANTASGSYSHAEGYHTSASDISAHAEGMGTTASGPQAHAEGSCTKSTHWGSHSEGTELDGLTGQVIDTTATARAAHAEGMGTTASGTGSHSEGGNSTASGNYSHAEGGVEVLISNNKSTPFGGTVASGNYSHTEGIGTIASGDASHAEGGYETATSSGVITITTQNTASGYASHAEGKGTTASGAGSHAEGLKTYSYTDPSTQTVISNTDLTVASGQGSHAEGIGTQATGDGAHTEGFKTTTQATVNNATVDGLFAHAEGNQTIACGQESHAEGYSTTAQGATAHAEGNLSQALGDNSHAEGSRTIANGGSSHAQNWGTIASSNNQTALGKWNLEDNNNTYAVIIGNGSATTRSNALAVDWSGNIYCNGSSISINEELVELVDSGAKNLLKNTATTKTVQGVVFEVNSDGSVYAHGTNTGSGTALLTLAVAADLASIPNNVNYVLSGCTGGSSSTYDLRWFHYSASASAYNESSPIVFKKNQTTSDSNVAIAVKAGKSIDTTIYPMVCTTTAWAVSQAYVPYCPTMAELYAMIKAL